MQINVIFANPERPLWLKLTLTDGSTVQDAIANSGLLDQFPHLNFNNLKTGIFGKFAKPDTTLKSGDRVEIYQPITSDPKRIKQQNQNTQVANINA